MSTRRIVAVRPLPNPPTLTLASLVALACAVALLSTAAQAQRRERSGKEVVDTTCAACHATGENGAPKIGDAKAWAPRASQGLTSLTDHALKGIRNMPAHGGAPAVSDIEIERAIIHMVNASGGHWIEPLGGATPAVLRTSEQVVQTACVNCHRDGVDGAPKIGDRAAWVPRLKRGLDTIVQSAVHGHGGMPARGGVADLSDLELRGAVVYMFNYGAPIPAPAPQVTKASLDPFHKVVDGADVYLGVMRADAIAPAAMPSKPPGGKDVHHVNISLFDAKTQMPITDAQIKVKVADPLGGETKALEIISANNTVSYGGWFRMPNKNAYTITALIQRPGAGTTEARFDYKAR